MEYGFNKTKPIKSKQLYFSGNKNAFLDKGKAAFYLDFS